MIAKFRKREGEYILSIDGTILYKYMGGKYAPSYVDVPETVRVIAEGAFRCWEEVKRGPASIVMTENVKRIESKAFYGCPFGTSLKNIPEDVKLESGWNDTETGSIMKSTDKIWLEERYLIKNYPDRAFKWQCEREQLFHTKGKIIGNRQLGYNYGESSIVISTESEIPICYFLRQLPVWIYVIDEETGETVQKIWSGYGTKSSTYPGEIVEMLCYIAKSSTTFDYTWYEEIFDSIQESRSKDVIAKLRLENPIGLTEIARKKYRSQLLRDARVVLGEALRKGNIELIREYKELNIITKATRNFLWENMPESMDVEVIQLLQG